MFHQYEGSHAYKQKEINHWTLIGTARRTVGIAVVVNRLSTDVQQYFAAGAWEF
ncbi:MAG: hypothetical protein ACXU8A_07870 [Burkholderiaceae bacterium]